MGMFGGGVGKALLGSLGDGLLLASGNKPQYWPAQTQLRQNQMLLDRQAQMQNLEYQRQLALKQYERDNPAPGTLEINSNFLAKKDPNLAKAYLNNAADPVIQYQNPMSGLIDAIHKSGAPVAKQNAVANGTKATINGKDAWFVNGDWYDNPEGR